jgi:hypothetical protein
MGCFLGTIHQLMTQLSTNKKDAHPAPGSAPWSRSAGQPVAEMAGPWPKGPSVAVMTGKKVGIPGCFA